MRVAHFDCFSGISGDMVLGAVIDAGVPADAIRAALDSLGLPITLEVETGEAVRVRRDEGHRRGRRTRRTTASCRTSRRSSRRAR